MIEIIKEATLGSVGTITTIMKYVIPIMVVLQLFRDYKILDKIVKPFEFFSRIFNISKSSVTPLLVGIIFGLSFGAGVIIQTAKEGNLSKRDLFLMVAFLAACHAIIEDTLILVAVGANGFILLGSRLVAAFIMTYLLSKYVSIEDIEELEQAAAKEV
ncbi:hypothetical protein SAMN05660297_02876 [Natronincola peptidivorans]|uniref:Nucleoside transporter/FeoB GTPase Gate domain-containing protein n=1 Tax=Natronincola peptidivorans TaxID=426128 RepID=A0A1I0FN80_9FIRM|nr:nucleoside recognition domain-containing protein [Natronincola peptidivorans]SET59598.1 hypothetical protein SAMN05660297_02876 [Natronincola peptidivorans]